MKHFVCDKCGNLVALVQGEGKRLSCCSTKMDEIVPNSSSASKEKHTPVLNVKNGEVRVSVGSADNAHPMLAEHAISWVCLVTDKGSQRKTLVPDGKAEAVFRIGDDEKILKVFAYCNLHGLWVTEVKN